MQHILKQTIQNLFKLPSTTLDYLLKALNFNELNCEDNHLIVFFFLFQWKKRMERQRAAIKFKAAARIARVSYDLTNLVRQESHTSNKANDDQNKN